MTAVTVARLPGMTPTYSVTGRRRHLIVSGPAESVPQGPVQSQDPPIYRALMRTWADRGRTLPGRHDPEWVRLVAPPGGLDQFGTAFVPFAARGPFGTSDRYTTNGTYGSSFSGWFRVTRDQRGDGR